MKLIDTALKFFNRGFTPEPPPLPRIRPRRMADWIENPYRNYPEDKKKDEWFTGRVDKAFALLVESPTFISALQQHPDLADVPVRFARLKTGSGLYDHGNDSIVQHHIVRKDDFSRRLVDKFVSVMAHEFRHACQSRDGHLFHALGMESTVLSGFVTEADACAFQATVTWEIGIYTDNYRPWDIFAATHPLCAESFQKEIAEDHKAYFDGRAQNAAFLAWFQDKTTVNYYAGLYLENLQRWIDQPLEELVKPKAPPQEESRSDVQIYQTGLPVLFEAQNKKSYDRKEGKPEQDKSSKPSIPYIDEEEGLTNRDLYLDKSLLPPVGKDFYMMQIEDALYAQLEKMDEKIRQKSVDLATARSAPGNAGQAPESKPF